MTERPSALHLAGVATIAGAAIDILGPAIYPRLAEPWPHLVYVTIDLLLLIGMLGVRAATARTTGVLAVTGLVLALFGVLLVRTSAARIFGDASSVIAASAWSVGMVIWSVDLLRAKGRFRVAAGLWIAALPIGLAGLVLKDHGVVSHLAKLSFIVGFIAAGVDLIKARGETA